MNPITYPHFSFTYKETSWEKARLGTLQTPHGIVETPNFIFCATKASIKGVPSHLLKELGTQIILSNTYHLILRPGADTIESLGGLHPFMNNDLPMLTDSGGYQIFAMGHGSVSQEIKGKRQVLKKSLLKISEEGAIFKSYVDGKILELTPESCIQIQKKLGADLIVQLDECTPFHVEKPYTEKSMHLSLRWAKRSLDEFSRTNDGKQAIYGVVQGGVYEDLRIISANSLKEMPFFGMAIGGSLGVDRPQMQSTVALTRSLLPPERPVHLLGIGTVEDVFFAVSHGIDTLDCVHPTRIARHGWAIMPRSLVKSGKLNLLNSSYQLDERPIDETVQVPFLKEYSRAYLHHLFKAQEILGLELVTMHNIHQMNRLMKDIREGLQNNSMDEVKRFWLGQ